MKSFDGLMAYITGPRVSDREFLAFMSAAADRGLTLRQYVWQRVLDVSRHRKRKWTPGNLTAIGM